MTFIWLYLSIEAVLNKYVFKLIYPLLRDILVDGLAVLRLFFTVESLTVFCRCATLADGRLQTTDYI